MHIKYLMKNNTAEKKLKDQRRVKSYLYINFSKISNILILILKSYLFNYNLSILCTRNDYDKRNAEFYEDVGILLDQKTYINKNFIQLGFDFEYSDEIENDLFKKISAIFPFEILSSYKEFIIIKILYKTMFSKNMNSENILKNRLYDLTKNFDKIGESPLILSTILFDIEYSKRTLNIKNLIITEFKYKHNPCECEEKVFNFDELILLETDSMPLIFDKFIIENNSLYDFNIFKQKLLCKLFFSHNDNKKLNDLCNLTDIETISSKEKNINFSIIKWFWYKNYVDIINYQDYSRKLQKCKIYLVKNKYINFNTENKKHYNIKFFKNPYVQKNNFEFNFVSCSEEYNGNIISFKYLLNYEFDFIYDVNYDFFVEITVILPYCDESEKTKNCEGYYIANVLREIKNPCNYKNYDFNDKENEVVLKKNDEKNYIIKYLENNESKKIINILEYDLFLQNCKNIIFYTGKMIASYSFCFDKIHCFFETVIPFLTKETIKIIDLNEKILIQKKYSFSMSYKLNKILIDIEIEDEFQEFEIFSYRKDNNIPYEHTFLSEYIPRIETHPFFKSELCSYSDFIKIEKKIADDLIFIDNTGYFLKFTSSSKEICYVTINVLDNIIYEFDKTNTKFYIDLYQKLDNSYIEFSNEYFSLNINPLSDLFKAFKNHVFEIFNIEKDNLLKSFYQKKDCFYSLLIRCFEIMNENRSPGLIVEENKLYELFYKYQNIVLNIGFEFHKRLMASKGIDKQLFIAKFYQKTKKFCENDFFLQ